MSWAPRVLVVRVLALFSTRRQSDSELNDEIESHLHLAADDFIARGMTPHEARRQALVRLGGVSQTKEAYRDRRSIPMVESLWRDIRYAIRGFRRTPTFTVVAVVSLTVAIGATTAVFSLLHALAFRPLPVRDPYSLVQIGTQTSPFTARLSFPAFRELEREQQAFTSLTGLIGISVFDVEIDGRFARAATMGVTANFYTAFDVHPFAGRLFAADESARVPVQTAVLGYGFWKRTFGGDLSVVGKTIHIDRIPLTVIGIAPEGFTNLNIAIEPAITVPLLTFPVLLTQRVPVVPWTEDPEVTWVTTIGRLKGGVTLEQARAQLQGMWPAIRASLAPAFVNSERRRDFLTVALNVQSAATGWEHYGVRSRFIRPFFVILGIAAVVLLIACVNLASLMLSRAAARQHEIAIRVALGADRSSLARQLLTEGLLLSVTGAAGGIAVTMAVAAVFPQIVFAGYLVPMSFDASPDGSVFAFASALAIVTALLFSLVPVWRVTRGDPAGSLQSQHRTIAQTGRIGRLLVATQIALCLVLVSSAGLLVRSLQEIRSVDIGLQTRDVAVAYPTPRPGAYTTIDNDSYYPQLIERIRSIPGVTAVGVSQLKPLGGQPALWKVGASGSDETVMAVYTSASPGLFDALRIPLLSGRDFAWSDDSRGRLVAIVSQSLARRLFGNTNPVGREIRIGPDAELDHLEVIGVIGDARSYDVKDPNVYAAYIPSLQRGAGANGKALVVRGSVTEQDLSKAIEPLGNEYVTSITSLNEILDNTLLQERLTGMVAGFFGAVSLMLSAIGLYGLMAYSVVQRQQDIVIRVALGAQAQRIIGQVLWDGLKLAIAGAVVGLAISWTTARLLRSLLFNVQPHDLLSIGLTLALILLVAIAACLVPAYRATRAEPAFVLRGE